MKKMFLVLLVGLTSTSGFAAMSYTTAGVVGIRSNHAVVDGASSKDQLKFQAGVLVTIPLNEVISFRTGGLLAMKDSSAEVANITADVKRLFLDIPATLQFGNDFVKGYAGFDLGIKLSSECSVTGAGSCTFKDEKSFVIQPVIGVDFAVAPLIKVGGFYELETEYNKDWKQSALGVNASYQF